MQYPNTRMGLICAAIFLAACSPSHEPAQPAAGNSASALTVTLRPYAQPLVPVVIKGKTYHFLLDTGSPYSFIDVKTAAAISRQLPAADVPEYFRTYIEGLSALDGPIDPSQHTYWKTSPMSIGNHVVDSSVPWVGLDLSTLELSYGSHVDGLLGANAFRQLNWEFDNTRHLLTIGSLPPSTAAYAQCSALEDQFGGGPDLTVTLANGNGGPMRIDTGATYGTSSPANLQAFQEQGAVIEPIGKATRLSVNGPYDANRYLVKGLHLGSTPIGGLPFYENGGGSITLGMDFLSRFDKYVFIPSEMLFCYSAPNLTRDDAKPLREIELSANRGRLLIGHANASPDSLAKGLQDDDVLMYVNGKAVDAADIEALRHQLTHTANGELVLTVERQGKPRTVSF